MPVVLKYNASTRIPVELDGLLPSVTRDKSLQQLVQLEAQHGNERLPLAELFKISGDPRDECIELEGDLRGVHRIGERMDFGSIVVRGDAGDYAGSRMSGGKLIIEGNAGNYLALAMRGGRVRVHGSAGDEVASARPGHSRGMTGGEVLVDGDVGQLAGRSMRRGLIAIGGSSGNYLGFNMLAGTILVFGRCGSSPGAGMRRGTIGLFDRQATELLPTFAPACQYRPQFMSLVLNHLRDLGFSKAASFVDCEWELHHGDMLELGRGEILFSRVQRAEK